MNWANFDMLVTNAIRQDKGDGFLFLMKFISFWGESYFMVLTVLVAAGLLFMKGFKKEAYFTLGVFVADIANVGLKLLFNRSRPEDIDIYPKFQQGSFPSGHVVHYVVFFGFLLLVMATHQHIPKPIRQVVGALCVFLIIGVSFSRVYLGTHWPTDILVAYVIGLVMLSVIGLCYKRG